MSQKVAPWLQGLDEAWEEPKENYMSPQNLSSASHGADSLCNNSRPPKRGLSGLPSSLSSQRFSQASTQIKRSPLGSLSNSTNNVHRKEHCSTKPTSTRSFSDASNGSVLQCGTVQIQARSKSASPLKKQQTLEWQRRLVRGQIEYGDQTDLFGPSGLENIFAPTGRQENGTHKARANRGWLHQNSGIHMASSPPPWPSSFADETGLVEGQSEGEGTQLEMANQDNDGHERDEEVFDAKFASDPFNLHYTDEADQAQQHRSSVQQARGARSECSAALGNRTISGQTELEQEDFSPVFISKHTTVNGQVNYQTLDSHLVKSFGGRDNPGRQVSEQDTVGRMDRTNKGEDPSEFTGGPQSDFLPALPDLSLSENLSTGTPPVASLGRYVETKRGGYSMTGSFKQRLLSPSPSKTAESYSPNASEMLSTGPKAACKPLPARTKPDTVGTPLRPQTPNQPKTRSSGSPLKLFGPHDTFTNNRLLRRMSQLDPEEKPVREPECTNQQQGQEDVRDSFDRVQSHVSNQNSFGSGDLNGHIFNAEITITSASDSDRDVTDRSPGSEIPAPGSKTPFGFQVECTPDVQNTFKLKRRLSKNSATSKVSSQDNNEGNMSGFNAEDEDGSELNEEIARTDNARSYEGGKRPPNSPSKKPTPKRRRTLHASEFQDVTNVNHSYHNQTHKASRKRKDARRGEAHNVAEPDVLAHRKILRPRNPTPSQDRRQQIEAELKQAAEEFAVAQPDKLEAVIEQMESSMTTDAPPTLQQQAEAVASEVAAFTLKVSRPSCGQVERKRSVTTQDFLNEAMMVMNWIRAKARPHSGLGSVEESEADEVAQASHWERSSDEDQSLRVSRPPSREGRLSGWRSALQTSTDARVVSHLRRFAERDDTEFIAESIASLHIDEEESKNENVVVVDEHCNIRITAPLSQQTHHPEDDDTSHPVSQRSQGSTLHSHRSADMSTGRTVGTGSTRKSDNVGILAPDAVAHLIGEQVGAMTFDKGTQRWVRVKSPKKQAGTGFLEPPSQVTSDDDPFQEISDLPVDEQVELRRVSGRDENSHQQEKDRDQESACGQSKPQQQDAVKDQTSFDGDVVPRPVTRDSSHIRHNHSSSVPSRYTALASSQHEKVETRATSWSDEELARLSALGKARQQPLAYAAAQATLALRRECEPSHDQAAPKSDQKILNSRAQQPVAENGTIAELDSSDQTATNAPWEDTVLALEDSEVEEIDFPKRRQTPSKLPFPPSSTYRGTGRQMSLRRKTLTSGFVADTCEQSELSLVAALPGDRVMSVSVSVSRPVATRGQVCSHIQDIQSSPSRNLTLDPSFYWSDLPEFTVHEEDAERPSERALATRLAQHAAAEIDDRYTLAVRDLVRTLTDVQEGEPYWEEIKQLDLRNKSLTALYGLDDFCKRVQDMDVSGNALTHLHGVSITIRRFVARSNRLSSLTCWNQLTNLQYLDISDNQLDSLHGLAHLIHLRELCADDNAIANIDGILELDGLLKLRLRRNRIDHVDFTNCQLQRLTELDLVSNQTSIVDGLDNLPALSCLKLDHNPLDSGLRIKGRMPQMQTLSLSGCGLQSLDVLMLPCLRRLNVDDNSLSKIAGIESLKQLETLSMRSQDLPNGTCLSILDQPLEARTINLSRNTIPSLRLSTNFLNLQHLELASVGLLELPDDFGIRMPNLRAVNLNFNALTDIRPLLNIQQLERLSVCGNRLNRLRKSVATLAKMTSLALLDLRDNPVTQGFYTPALATHTSLVCRERSTSAADEDALADAMRLAEASLPRGHPGQDAHHQARMDESTKLRRRVYELLLANSCQKLEEVDGLPFEKSKAALKDSVFDRLLELGIVRKSR